MEIDRSLINHWKVLFESGNSNPERKYGPEILEKVDLKEIFPEGNAKELDLDEKLERVEKSFPNIWEYMSDKCDEKFKVEGAQRDVDDWDMWEVDLAGVYGDVETAVDKVFEHMLEKYRDGKPRTWEEMVYDTVDHLQEYADVPLDRLEKIGELVHNGSMKWGGYYPG